MLGHHGWAEAVVKPAVSVGAIGASRISIGGGGQRATALAEAAPDGEVLVQPFMAGVADGEVSILVLDGEVSHAVRKVPAAGDFRVHEFYGGTEVAHEPTSAELEPRGGGAGGGADRPPLLYARVDCVADDLGVPRLMELELIEPSLFLPYAPAARSTGCSALRLDPVCFARSANSRAPESRRGVGRQGTGSVAQRQASPSWRRTTTAGFPATTVRSGTSLTTTALAPTTEFSRCGRCRRWRRRCPPTHRRRCPPGGRRGGPAP